MEELLTVGNITGTREIEYQIREILD